MEVFLKGEMVKKLKQTKISIERFSGFSSLEFLILISEVVLTKLSKPSKCYPFQGG